MEMDHKRCFSYVDDCGDCMEQSLVVKKASKEIINIGPDEETITIQELAQLCANEVGRNKEPIFVPSRPQEVKFATCGSDKARKLLGNTKYIKESIKKTADFIRSNGIKEFEYHIDLEIKMSLLQTHGKKLI